MNIFIIIILQYFYAKLSWVHSAVNELCSRTAWKRVRRHTDTLFCTRPMPCLIHLPFIRRFVSILHRVFVWPLSCLLALSVAAATAKNAAPKKRSVCVECSGLVFAQVTRICQYEYSNANSHRIIGNDAAHKRDADECWAFMWVMPVPVIRHKSKTNKHIYLPS